MVVQKSRFFCWGWCDALRKFILKGWRCGMSKCSSSGRCLAATKISYWLWERRKHVVVDGLSDKVQDKRSKHRMCFLSVGEAIQTWMVWNLANVYPATSPHFCQHLIQMNTGGTNARPILHPLSHPYSMPALIFGSWVPCMSAACPAFSIPPR